MSSFMTPLESRQTENVNKVRMFKHGDFSEGVRDEKWDRVKIVCTQPFNKHVQYGLSFVNLYCAEGKNGGTAPGVSIGKYQLRPESPDNFSPGSLFARRKNVEGSGDQSPNQHLKGAAAIREATSIAHSGSPLPKQKVRLSFPWTPTAKKPPEEESSKTPKERRERNRNDLLYNKDEEEKHEKIDKLIEKRAEEKAEANKKLEQEREKEKKRLANKQTDTPKTPRESKDIPSKKRKPKDPQNSVEPKKSKKIRIKKPFERLLEGVVLVISGIQNPDRANLRTLALSMGAKYRPDWDNTCTHLICAFTNTPKFNLVKGKGKIVTKKWIEECHSQRKRLPWRRYALDKADKGVESEDEIWEEERTQAATESDIEIDTAIINSDDETMQKGSDTEEIVAEIIKKQKREKEEDIYLVDTDNETIEPVINGSLKVKRKLENFFKAKIFFVDTKLDEEVARRVKQYIAAYDGIIAEELEATIDIIVTDGADYKLLQDIYPNASFVTPDWIWECHNLQKLAPMTDFLFQ
ncbi:DNA repair protein XRCC1 isoform X2 [Anthonomus grandis grandis]|nr:DNA repair protein XRCC1 isoform X2 [Anthonomus grandis grandis]